MSGIATDISSASRQLRSVATAFSEGADASGASHWLPAALTEIEEALRLVSATVDVLAHDLVVANGPEPRARAGERTLSHEQQVHFKATVCDLAQEFSRCARSCGPGPHRRSPTSRTANIGAPGPPGLTDALHPSSDAGSSSPRRGPSRTGAAGAAGRSPPTPAASSQDPPCQGMRPVKARSQGRESGNALFGRFGITSIMARGTAAANGQSHPSCEGAACGDGHVQGAARAPVLRFGQLPAPSPQELHQYLAEELRFPCKSDRTLGVATGWQPTRPELDPDPTGTAATQNPL